MVVKKIFNDNHLLTQKKPYTCGPVSLLNVLRLKGDPSHDEDELEKLCDAKEFIGTTNEDLVKVARHIGLDVAEVKEGSTLHDIERNLDQGNYVIINYRNAFSGNGHYSVVTDYDEEAYYLFDSTLGLLRLKKDYLKQNWYGQPNPETLYGWFMAIK